MPEPLIVVIPHRLGKDEALRRIRDGLGRAKNEFSRLITLEEEIWTGDHLAFRITTLGQTASGSIDAAEDHVRLEVVLPWLLARLAESFQPLIRKEGTLLLEKQ